MDQEIGALPRLPLLDRLGQEMLPVDSAPLPSETSASTTGSPSRDLLPKPKTSTPVSPIHFADGPLTPDRSRPRDRVPHSEDEDSLPISVRASSVETESETQDASPEDYARLPRPLSPKSAHSSKSTKSGKSGSAKVSKPRSASQGQEKVVKAKPRVTAAQKTAILEQQMAQNQLQLSQMSCNVDKLTQSISHVSSQLSNLTARKSSSTSKPDSRSKSEGRASLKHDKHSKRGGSVSSDGSRGRAPKDKHSETRPQDLAAPKHRQHGGKPLSGTTEAFTTTQPSMTHRQAGDTETKTQHHGSRDPRINRLPTSTATRTTQSIQLPLTSVDTRLPACTATSRSSASASSLSTENREASTRSTPAASRTPSLHVISCLY